MVVCGMGNVGPWVFDELLRGVPGADEWQAILSSDGKYDVIEAEFELSDGRRIPSWSFMDSALSATNKTTITTRAAQLGTIIRGHVAIQHRPAAEPFGEDDRDVLDRHAHIGQPVLRGSPSVLEVGAELGSDAFGTWVAAAKAST